jgi:hypothetical protein
MVSSFVMCLIEREIKTKSSDGYSFLSFVSFYVKQKLYNSDDYGICILCCEFSMFSNLVIDLRCNVFTIGKKVEWCDIHPICFLSFVSFHVKQKLYNSDDYGICILRCEFSMFSNLFIDLRCNVFTIGKKAEWWDIHLLRSSLFRLLGSLQILKMLTLSMFCDKLIKFWGIFLLHVVHRLMQ